MKGNLYTIIYAAALSIACALLLTAASELTAHRREANEQAEEMKNVLAALKVPVDAGVSPQELVGIFEENIRVEKAVAEEGGLELYIYSPKSANGETVAAAVKFAGPGLWGPIKGFLALEPDMKTIRGITFYEQEETPGLGGEIATPAFTSQFEGKTIVDQQDKSGLVILTGKSDLAQNEIDGITGATMTCDKVQEMLNAVIDMIVEVK